MCVLHSAWTGEDGQTDREGAGGNRASGLGDSKKMPNTSVIYILEEDKEWATHRKPTWEKPLSTSRRIEGTEPEASGGLTWAWATRPQPGPAGARIALWGRGTCRAAGEIRGCQRQRGRDWLKAVPVMELKEVFSTSHNPAGGYGCSVCIRLKSWRTVHQKPRQTQALWPCRQPSHSRKHGGRRWLYRRAFCQYSLKASKPEFNYMQIKS